jgi:hypothetical protein
VADTEANAGALLEFIDAFGGIHVIEGVVGQAEGVRRAAVPGAVFGDEGTFDEGAVLFVFGTEVDVGVPTGTNADGDGKWQFFLKLIPLAET